MRMTFCVACGSADAEALEHHHLVPRSAGGSDDEANLITLCHACHGKMHGYERANVRRLTKIGLQAAKARGRRLGGDRGNFATVRAAGNPASAVVRAAKADKRAADLAPTIRELQAGNMSLRGIAAELTARGYPTVRGGERWSAVQVRRVLERTA